MKEVERNKTDLYLESAKVIFIMDNTMACGLGVLADAIAEEMNVENNPGNMVR